MNPQCVDGSRLALARGLREQDETETEDLPMTTSVNLQADMRPHTSCTRLQTVQMALLSMKSGVGLCTLYLSLPFLSPGIWVIGRGLS